MQDRAEAMLAAAGYAHYETSAFASLSGAAGTTHHWQFGDHLGIGAGALLATVLPDRIVRETRPAIRRTYMARGQARQRARRNQVVELGSALRVHDSMPALNGGVAHHCSRRAHRLAPATMAERLADARAEGLLESAADGSHPTGRGRRFLNVLLRRFLPA